MFRAGLRKYDEDELPGSTDWLKLDGDVGLGRANKRADLVKVESLLANSGDLDLSDIGGPTGYGLYTVEDCVKKYQRRNGLDVDGWMRPGGPTISKMEKLLGGLLGGYPAPTPAQVDLHHRLRAQGKDGLLNVELPPISLKGNPIVPPADKATHGSNESWVGWMTRHQKGLGGAPDMLATYIENFGIDGVAQARDFVEQWEKAMPGEGASAIRAVLSRLSDPAQQRAFLGGDLPKGTPFGVLKPDAAARIAETRAPAQTADAAREQDRAYAPVGKTAYSRGSPPGDAKSVQVASNDADRSDAMPESGDSQQPAQASSKRENPSRESFKGGDTTPEYRDLIVAKEANGIASPLEAFNRTRDGTEVLGKYQMNRNALVDAGFKNADGSWKEGNALGINSDEEFLRGPRAKAAQDAAFEAVSRRNEQQVKSMGLDKKIGSKIDGIKAGIEVTETGLAAAAHRGGVGSVKEYFVRLEKHGWDSKKAVDALSGDEKRMYLAVETRLREFSNVGYRTHNPDS
jgi:hypothetical protein